ncbi:MAG: hypothetical protein FJY85_24385, partial [Deltaproteobacteria bacterium]|nr:hypothetical protein [Deltaproteobacteria bacterium]
MEARVIAPDKLCTWADEAIQRLQEGFSADQRLVALMRCTRIFKNGGKEYQAVLERAWNLICPREDGKALNTSELIGLGPEGKKLVEDVCGWWLELTISRDLTSKDPDFVVLPKLLVCVCNATKVVQDVCGKGEARGFLEPRLEKLEQDERGRRMVRGDGAEHDAPEMKRYRDYIANLRRWQPQREGAVVDPPPPPVRTPPNIWLKFDEKAEKIAVSDHSTGDRNRAATVRKIKVLNGARQPIRRRGWFGNSLYDLVGTPYQPTRPNGEGP